MDAPKVCRKCQTPKSSEHFYANPPQPCKACWKARVQARYALNEAARSAHAAQAKEWRTKNLTKARASAKVAKAKRKRLIQAWVRDYKSSNPCSDCGRKLPYWVMQFDHRPDEEKVIEVALLVKRNTTYSQVAAEVAKCDLVCVVCHRHRTYCRKKGIQWTPLTQVQR